MEATTAAFLAGAGFAIAAARQRLAVRQALPKLVTTSAYAAKRAALVREGLGTSQIILDFDRCITTYWGPQGGRGLSCHGILERRMDESKQATIAALNNYYWPIETSPSLTREEKIPLMIEWYTKVNELLGSDLSRADIELALEGANLSLRPGMKEVLQFAGARPSLPCTIFSAGVGDVIIAVLRKLVFPGGIPPNIHVVSNFMQFEGDEPGAPPGQGKGTGRLAGWSPDLVHMFNKHFAAHPEYETLGASHPNVLLAGDSLGDATMANGIVAPRTVLRVGFLNHDIEALLPQYEAAFDAIVLEDGPAYLLLDILKEAEAADAAAARTVAAAAAGAPATAVASQSA